MLRLLADRPAGRPTISRLLGLGERSVKTLLSHTEKAGLTVTTPHGAVLAPRGRTVLDDIVGFMYWGRGHGVLCEGDCFYCNIECVEGPNTLTEVYIFRDHVVMEGCRASIIGGMRDGELVLPGVPDEIVRAVSGMLPRNVNRGVIILAPAYCQYEILTACISLLYRECASHDTTRVTPRSNPYPRD